MSSKELFPDIAKVDLKNLGPHKRVVLMFSNGQTLNIVVEDHDAHHISELFRARRQDSQANYMARVRVYSHDGASVRFDIDLRTFVTCVVDNANLHEEKLAADRLQMQQQQQQIAAAAARTGGKIIVPA